MITILRYEIPNAINDIELPIGYEMLNVGIATDDIGRERISIWCKVDVQTNYKPYPGGTEIAKFCIFGTGADMGTFCNFEHKYIGTVQKSNEYAFHVFQVFNK